MPTSNKLGYSQWENQLCKFWLLNLCRYNERSYRRRLRTNRTHTSPTDNWLKECHHCLKYITMNDLVRWSQPKCGLYYCIKCIKKYRPTLKIKTFIYMKEKQPDTCLVCQKRCMCKPCQKKAIDDDLTKIAMLIAKSSQRKPNDSDKGNFFIF